jgi:hypothetical protein
VIESRKHSGGLSPADTHELEELVFELVRERLLKAVGTAGMWTMQFRSASDTDSLFGETIAEFIARDIATHIATPVSISSDDARSETETEDEIASDDIRWVESESPSEMSLGTAEPEVASEPEVAFEPEMAAESEVTSEFEVTSESESDADASEDAAEVAASPESLISRRAA